MKKNKNQKEEKKVKQIKNKTKTIKMGNASISFWLMYEI